MKLNSKDKGSPMKHCSTSETQKFTNRKYDNFLE